VYDAREAITTEIATKIGLNVSDIMSFQSDSAMSRGVTYERVLIERCHDCFDTHWRRWGEGGAESETCQKVSKGIGDQLVQIEFDPRIAADQELGVRVGGPERDIRQWAKA
jgi:hypothetical protein